MKGVAPQEVQEVQEVAPREVAESVSLRDAAFGSEPPDWWWAPGLVTFFVVSMFAALVTEAVKGWFDLKSTAAWRRAGRGGRGKFAKIGLLFPILGLVGGLAGVVAFTRVPAMYREGPLVEDAVVAFLYGTIAPVFAVPLWETVNFLIRLFRRTVARRAGADTQDIAALEGDGHSDPDLDSTIVDP